ncbi:MAG: hypothetical protein OEZ51_10230, partial [Nitrospinota bacterium]|nr:hypothetical protein [Nitrospinota bacterium]
MDRIGKFLLPIFHSCLILLGLTLLVPAWSQAAVTPVTGTIASGFTFQEGETYLVSGTVTMTGATTFEGGAVIKFDATGSLNVSTPIFSTTASNRAVFTSKHDNSVGETVAGSTGSPSSYPNALTVANGTVRFIEVRYAANAILFSGNGTLSVKDSEFLATGTPVNASSSSGPATVNLVNLLIVQGTNGPVLADNGTNALTVNANNLTLAHLSGVGFNNTMTAAGSALNVADSLFVDVQGASVFAGTAPATENYNAFYQTPDNGTGANNVALASDPLLTDWYLDQTSAAINAGSQLPSAAGLYHYSTDANGAIEANSQVDIGYHAPPDINTFAIVATNSVFLDATTVLHSGNVAVNDIGPGPYLKPEASLYISKEITTPAGVRLMGDSVRVNSAAVVASDVHYNSLNLIGTINGQQVTPLSHPVFDALPLFRSAQLGAAPADVIVGAAQQVTLPPGEYNNITVGKAGSIVFSGGTYHIGSL